MNVWGDTLIDTKHIIGKHATGNFVDVERTVKAIQGNLARYFNMLKSMLVFSCIWHWLYA